LRRKRTDVSLVVSGPSRDDEAVQKTDLIAGRKYALRARGKKWPTIDRLVKVRYLGRAHKDQITIRHETGPLTGLEEWVRTRNLACAWSDRTAYLRDQERSARLAGFDSQVGDRVTDDAISAVLTASGEYTGFAEPWTTDPDSAGRFWARAGLDGSPLEHHQANYVDRDGQWRLSYLTALAACQGFAVAEPETVDLYLRGLEEELRAEGFLPGNRYSHDLLREWAPAHALARSWSQIPRGEVLERELRRLQGLVRNAAGILRRHGFESDAVRIESSLRGR